MLTPYVIAFLFVSMVLLAACRGEPVPRDYQNQPPRMSQPVDSPAEAPSSTAIASPELDSGAQGTSAPYATTTSTAGAASETAAPPSMPPNAITVPEATATSSTAPVTGTQPQR